ncbi:hypothetical protein WMI_01332 [Enterococcus faecalis EnGen0363]|uniref:helix-turn-helix transcriptional regulator n=1 Tax=Enterococcus faecalis TaxID=1351 RepID=UPI00032E5BCA|nr:helix-turn-helix transcriptional regulator [Enterococcus faecalis]EGO5850661.1 helix-turn-helix domain-containing protein [Enterococcus faecalis]EJI7258980.1 helix-turn-helix transcriptional regulator [Enterococcus faecalis]EOJ56136.1 hypothetical protein WMI_01332 [Enterococcus faecalis EnGen0363]NSM73091.1 helix-turn-helix transcriptional regulator [Enterococcus faecalis]NSM80892.1 helix-turn-helix transcriptional regulator [Enterococcus faecalis]
MKENFDEHQLIKDRIFYYLKKKDITPNRLAELSGIRQSTLSSMFNRNGVPKVDTIHAICKGLNISVRDFFDFPPYNQKQGESTDAELFEYLENVTEELEAIKQRLADKQNEK